MTQDPEAEEFSTEPLSGFEQAIAKFRGNYEKFAAKNTKYIRVTDDVQSAITKAGSEINIKRAADIFEKQIAATVEAKESKRKEADAKWTGKVGSFLKKIYPIARMSLQIASSGAEVTHQF